jgi:hypothetical protein
MRNSQVQRLGKQRVESVSSSVAGTPIEGSVLAVQTPARGLCAAIACTPG